jgi:hypothetical protein
MARFYANARSFPVRIGDFEIRYTGTFAPIAAAVQQTIHSIHRSLPATGVTTLDY